MVSLVDFFHTVENRVSMRARIVAVEGSQTYVRVVYEASRKMATNKAHPLSQSQLARDGSTKWPVTKTPESVRPEFALPPDPGRERPWNRG